MGVTSMNDEYTISVPPNRMFKALILDSHNLIPKLLPQSIKSIEFLEGEGGVGSIKKTNFHEGSQFKYLTHKIIAIDEDNYECNYALIEGDGLGYMVESISYEIKFEALNGGSMCKTTSHYHTKGEIELKEEDIKAGKNRAMEIYKLVEEYLLANPRIYA